MRIKTNPRTETLIYAVEEFMNACEAYETIDELYEIHSGLAAIYEETARNLGYTPPERFVK